MKLLVLNGPNLNMLGVREPGIYGVRTYDDLMQMIARHAEEIGVEVFCRQSNHEGELVDWIQQAYFDHVDGIVFNPGAYTHTSLAIADAVKAVNIPTVEVHISDVNAREAFRRVSYIGQVSAQSIVGQGLEGYLMAMDYLKACVEGGQ